jgi:hypothetical protein
MRFEIAPLTLAGIVGLACLNAWLLVWATADLTQESTTLAAVAIPDALSSSPDPQVALPKAKPITAYTQTLAKPVFLKSRTPYVPPPATPPTTASRPVAAPPPVPADPGLALGGVAITDTDKKAYIFSKSDRHGTWLREGETVMGWKVESIEATAARLQQGGRSVQLDLFPRKTTK